MQYILDCVTLLLNVVLCFYLLYGKYPVRSTHMVKRILLITAAVISKALIVYFFNCVFTDFTTEFYLRMLHYFADNLAVVFLQ